MWKNFKVLKNKKIKTNNDYHWMIRHKLYLLDTWSKNFENAKN